MSYCSHGVCITPLESENHFEWPDLGFGTKLFAAVTPLTCVNLTFAFFSFCKLQLEFSHVFF